MNKAPKSFKAADALVKKQPSKNPRGILKSTKIMGVSKNVPAKSSAPVSGLTNHRQMEQKNRGIY